MRKNRADPFAAERFIAEYKAYGVKMEEMKKHEKRHRTKHEKIEIAAYSIALASFILPVIYLIFKMIFGDLPENDAGYHSNADYILMIIQCLLGAVVINVPTILGKKFKFEVPPFLYIFYIFFLYCAIFLGEVRSFYYKFKWWDSFLHGTSSLMLGFFGFMVISIINRDENTVLNLSPFFLCLFAFCFAVTVGALWEIYEFTFDGLLGLNMQKFMTSDGTVLTGHAALADTMKDIITDSAGALVAVIIGYIGLKKDKKLLLVKKTEVGSKKKRKKSADGEPVSVTEAALSEIDAENGETRPCESAKACAETAACEKAEPCEKDTAAKKVKNTRADESTEELCE